MQTALVQRFLTIPSLESIKQSHFVYKAIVFIVFLNGLFSLMLGFSISFKIILVYTIFFILYRFLKYYLSKKDKSLERFIDYLFLYLVFCPLVSIFSYLGTSLSFPLANDLLQNLDGALGFNWVNFNLYFAHDYIQKALIFAYVEIFRIQFFIIIGFFCFLKKYETCLTMLKIVFITMFTCTLIGSFFPALGTSAYESIKGALGNQDQFNLILPNMPDYAIAFFGLRDGSITSVSTDMVGIITFPSYHTAGSVIALYYMWQVKYLRIYGILTNLIVILSAIVIGQHYLVDIIGGTALAIILIKMTAKK